MSEDKKPNFLEGKWITVANLILLIGIVIQQARWQQSVDNEIHSLKEHTIDINKHMPFENRIQLFVPRVELDSRLSNMETTLNEIKQDIKKNFNN